MGADRAEIGTPRLVVRLPNWIGDCLMALPALQALHRRGIAVRCVGRGWAPALLAGCPWPVAALSAGGFLDGGWHGQIRALRATASDRALLLTHSFSSAAVARLAGLPALGYARDARGVLLRVRLRFPRGIHEARRYWLLAEAARRWLAPGTEPLGRDPDPVVLPLGASQRASVEAAWRQAGLGEAVVLLCPVATGTVHGRDKHYPHFPELAAELRAAGREVAVLAPPGRAAELGARFPGCPVLGDLSMAGFAAALARARVVVANDSGPMHLAAAVATPVVTPFGVTRPGRTGAWSPRLVAVDGCGRWPAVERVRRAVEAAAGRHPPPAPAATSTAGP